MGHNLPTIGSVLTCKNAEQIALSSSLVNDFPVGQPSSFPCCLRLDSCRLLQPLGPQWDDDEMMH